MTRISGGTKVKGGFYWRLAEWQIVTLSGESGVLPGTPNEGFYRVPVFAMLLLAPVMGGLFVRFLPLIGFAMVLDHAAKATAGAARSAGLWLGATLAPSWRPGEAFFTGKGAAKGKSDETAGEAKADEHLIALEKEIDEKRQAK
jgi:hypothetical protein